MKKLAFLLLTIAAGNSWAACVGSSDMVCNVSSSIELENDLKRIGDNTTRRSATIKLLTDIPLHGIIRINEKHRGLMFNGNYRTLIAANPSTDAYYLGSLNIENTSNITLKDLTIQARDSSNTTQREDRNVFMFNSKYVLLKNVSLPGSLDLSQRPVDRKGTGLLMELSQNVVLSNLNISKIRGTGIHVRRSQYVSIQDSRIENMANARKSGLSNTNANYGIAVDSEVATTVRTEADRSSNINIFNNTLFNLPGQGIFVLDSDNVLVDDNDLTGIGIGDDCALNVDCGGRAIYVHRGRGFWVRNNFVDSVGGVKNATVDTVNMGGGINAGHPNNDMVFIEKNQVRNVGALRSSVTYTKTPNAQQDWNGFGISVIQNAVVSGNILAGNSVDGILVQPGASNVVLRDNTISYSGLNNIRVVAGFTYSGSALDVVFANNYDPSQLNAQACRLDPRQCFREPMGNSSAVYLFNNTLKNTTLNGFGVLMQQRKKSDLGTTYASKWKENWGYFDLAAFSNTMQNNNAGATGLRIPLPSALPLSSSATVPQYYVNRNLTTCTQAQYALIGNSATGTACEIKTNVPAPATGFKPYLTALSSTTMNPPFEAVVKTEVCKIRYPFVIDDRVITEVVRPSGCV